MIRRFHKINIQLYLLKQVNIFMQLQEWQDFDILLKFQLVILFEKKRKSAISVFSFYEVKQ